jgi:hypothetical protein
MNRGDDCAKAVSDNAIAGTPFRSGWNLTQHSDNADWLYKSVQQWYCGLKPLSREQQSRCRNGTSIHLCY